MLVRLLAGPDWRSARPLADAEFEQLPAVGHRIALAADGGWQVATVRAAVHRVMPDGDAADVALLLDEPVTAPLGREPLPLALLDGDNGAPREPRRGPWAR